MSDPSLRAAHNESHLILLIQELFGQTLTICLTDDEACLDQYKLQSDYSHVVPEYNISLKMVLPTTKFDTETHVSVTGSDIPSPQRETMNNIRQMAYTAYRKLPIFKK